MLALVFFAASFAIQAVSLGWPLSFDDRQKHRRPCPARPLRRLPLSPLHLLLRPRRYRYLTESIIHLSALSALALALLSVTALRPSNHAIAYLHVASLWHTVFALYAARHHPDQLTATLARGADSF